MRSASAIGLALVAVIAAAVPAQRSSVPARPLDGRGGNRGAPAGRSGAGIPGDAGNRRVLAMQVRQAFFGVVRRQLNLSDAQAARLEGVDRRFRQQRNQIQRDDHLARLGLAAAMQDSTSPPDQVQIASYMDQLVQGQHRRAALLEAEQVELAAFLTPLQRARYQALNEQLNRRIAQLRQNPAGAVVPPL